MSISFNDIKSLLEEYFLDCQKIGWLNALDDMNACEKFDIEDADIAEADHEASSTEKKLLTSIKEIIDKNEKLKAQLEFIRTYDPKIVEEAELNAKTIWIKQPSAMLKEDI